MTTKIRNNALFRKSLALLKQASRFVKRQKSVSSDYTESAPILANSFPKSGTHLLLQCLEQLPNIKNYGSFIASTPTLTFQERSKQDHVKLIRLMVPGELIPAHLFYHEMYYRELSRKNCILFFIYRDPRDVAVSEAFYLTFMNRWHRLHRYYASNLSTMDERISTAIAGISKPGFRYNYPNISKRFNRYRGWLNCSDVCSIKFEDLISEKRHFTLMQLFTFYYKGKENINKLEELVSEVEKKVSSTKPHTFRKGIAGEWQEHFTERHKDQMKEVAGELLIQLGYEKDLNW
jgi:hypothetical protein